MFFWGDMMMRIQRNTVVPIMLALVMAAILVAFSTFFVGVCEFHELDGFLGAASVTPGLTALFRSVYGFAWAIPLIAIGATVWLAKPPDRPAVHVAWTMALLTIVVFGWAVFAFIALYVLHVSIGYHI
jgi:hypothetical protein